MEVDCESEVDVDMEVDVSSVRSLRTAFTRSLAILDQDSRRLCANQHGPIPLISITCTQHSRRRRRNASTVFWSLFGEELKVRRNS